MHILEITKRANLLTYLIQKPIDNALFLKLYKAYVIPLLEYAYQIWSPYFQKDIIMLEKVQRRATKMVYGLHNIQYEQSLSNLGLTTLEQRRKRGDIIETYKILHNYYDLPELNNNFGMSVNHRVRGHSLKVIQASSTSNPWKQFLTNRIVRAWK